MENNLKIGQSFEVVEVINPRGFETDFIVGKTCLGINSINKPYGLMCSSNKYTESISFMYYLSRVGNEYKKIGKLTITKVKVR